MTAMEVRGAVGTLAGREGRRIVGHPITLVLLGYFVVLGVLTAITSRLSAGPAIHLALLLIGLLWFGPATFFAANLVASSARRAHVESQLAAAPTDESQRTLAVLAGVLVPTAVAAGFAAVLALVEHSGIALDRVQGPGELAAVPLCALGGGLLGVAVARWLPWRGMPLVVMFALIAWAVAVMNRGALWWIAPWTMSPVYYGNDAMGAGSHGWHAVYLLGLCGLAAIAALLRYPAHRRLLLALGALAGIVTLTAALAQLP
jgi:hypothetical protein